MKKKMLALVVAVALAVSAMSMLAVQAANGLDVEVNGSNITVKVTGTTGDKDWVGIYKEGETVDPDKDGAISLVWYYVTDTTKTINWPADKAVADATCDGASAKNRPDELNTDSSLKPGKYYAIVLANGGYEQVSGIDKVAFEIKSNELTGNYTEETTEFQSNIDSVNGTTLSGIGGLQFVVKGGFTFTDTTNMTGWLAVDAGIAGYQYSTDGETWKNAQYSITGREDVTKAGIPHQSGHDTCGFDITVSGTKDVETLYIRAITKDNKVVNFFALTTGDAASVTAPSIGTSDPVTPSTPDTKPNDKPNQDTPNTSTGDVSYLVAVIAVAAIAATIVLKKKRTEA